MGEVPRMGDPGNHARRNPEEIQGDLEEKRGDPNEEQEDMGRFGEMFYGGYLLYRKFLVINPSRLITREIFCPMNGRSRVDTGRSRMGDSYRRYREILLLQISSTLNIFALVIHFFVMSTYLILPYTE
jgi:hypothetical protein